MRKDKSPQQSLALSEQERQRRETEAGRAQQAISPYLAGSNQMSEYGRGLRSALATSTANTGENALANLRQRAQTAGFGSIQQPITFGAETGLASQQAQRIADIPRQVTETMAPLELQAAGQQAKDRKSVV